jgi:transcriptional antiterminator NusG
MMTKPMQYYTIQVKTGNESTFIKRFKAMNPGCAVGIHFLQRTLNERKNGVVKAVISPIFPGYLFVEIDQDDSIEKYHWQFRKTDGFYRFLKSNQDIVPLTGKDLETVMHFLKKTGTLSGVSLVHFDENSRIVIDEGPLKGLEGCIVKVDKRKGRAKIKLDMYGDSFAIDLAFEMIKKS